ncbi:myosin heavy chain, clone 203-like isoform X1 [Xenia sp. Carnegie-2017]|uniref:myosin heavy chain, clone 203-like isoform X1 n=2 Tax=Xenia sp. Carnegie-2017 TaxID=2897299 RepID=UPI001F03749B|nr:myosin heavy chain, clone 203-like isoform X1 [Xenia sp. Carnegie-2017]
MAAFSRSKTNRSTSPLRKSAPGSLFKSSGKDLRTSSSRGLAASFDIGKKSGYSTTELSKIENEYIRNLQQQIYFLELEANYLREQAKKATIIPPRLTEEAEKMMRKLRTLQSELDDRVTDIAKKESAIRLLENEREVSLRKLRDVEESHAYEKRELVNEIVSLKKFKEDLERLHSRRDIHVQQVENEASKGLNALQEAEEQISLLGTQLDDKTEELSRCQIKLEESRAECLKYQTQLREIEERFFQSDVKSKEDMGRELREEIRQLRLDARQKELNAQQDRTLRAKIQEDCTSLIKENAALAAQVVELRKQIDTDRAHKDEKIARRQANIQELVTLKDSERRLQNELETTREQLYNEKLKNREATQKLTREEKNTLNVTLSKNKLKTNVEELQNMNTIQSDENISLQRDKLLLTDEICDLQSKLDEKNDELLDLKSRLHEAESLCSQLESKVKMQKSLENIRWDEFHKMANTMSQLSKNMSPRKDQQRDYDE